MLVHEADVRAASSHDLRASDLCTSDGLTGFGGTVSDWNATRGPDADAIPGSSYVADPSLPQINGHTGAATSRCNQPRAW